jgi:hypothetical protein
MAGDAKVLLNEMVRLQDWLAWIIGKGKEDVSNIETPPKALLRQMPRKEVFQEAAALGFQQVANEAADALAGAPAPKKPEIDYDDPDDEDDDE